MMSAVGDAVQVLPVVTALRRTFPGSRISWVLQAGPKNLVHGHAAVDDLILFPRSERGRTAGSLLRSLRSLKRTASALNELATRELGGSFDVLLDLQVYLKAGLMTALAPARVKLGFDRHRARDLNRLFTTHRIPSHPRGFGHIQDQYFEFLTFMGVDPEPVDYGLFVRQEERDQQRRFFQPFPQPVCAIVVATSDPRKNWHAQGYATVAQALRSDFGIQPILVGGHSESEDEMAHEILARAPGCAVDARGGDLRRLLWQLDGSALVISPDTGPMHMARALEVPVVSLFGFTNPKRSGPYRRYKDLIVDGYAKWAGEPYEPSPEKRAQGMGRVRAEMVLEKVSLALERYGGAI
jgi:heptosyltransferase I